MYIKFLNVIIEELHLEILMDDCLDIDQLIADMATEIIIITEEIIIIELIYHYQYHFFIFKEHLKNYIVITKKIIINI